MQIRKIESYRIEDFGNDKSNKKAYTCRYADRDSTKWREEESERKRKRERAR